MAGLFPHRGSPRRTLLATISLLTLAIYFLRNALFAPAHSVDTEVELDVGYEPLVARKKVKATWMGFDPKPPLPLERAMRDGAKGAKSSNGGRNRPHDREQIAVALPLEEHRYRSDGLLEVNPNGPHPIFELIRNAEAAWDAKLARASKNLDEAVAEYERRYTRLPPRGFDAWWAYVEKHGVQLPDEYDQIYEDLEPFWGMDPRDLQRMQEEWEDHRDSYTLGKTDKSPISVVNSSLPDDEQARRALGGPAHEIMDLMRDVEESIPAFRAVFSPHDNPNLPTDWELKQQALSHAAAGTFLDLDDPPPVKLNGWLAGCAPDSPAILSPLNWDVPAPPQKTKTFIHNHKLTMDPCLHPSLLVLHGQFLSHGKGPVPHRFMPPQFSYSPSRLHHDITPAMPINWVSDLPDSANPDWDDKFDERLQWRGGNTGMWHDSRTRWSETQRVRAVALAGIDGGDGKENVTILKGLPEDQRVGNGEDVKWARWAPAMLDVAFANKAWSCEPETCEKLERMFEFRKPQDMRAAGNYKYILDIDGNGWSSRFKRLITSNSLIFKSTIYPEWFTDRIAPWVHYIPVHTDLSDLPDSLTFFRGDPNGVSAHDALAKKIATAGREWSLTFWRKEDLTAYMFRLFLEYARVMSTDRLEMNYHHD